MEDLIPLLIIILISIVGMIGRKKKKRDFDEGIATPYTSAPKDDLYSWLEKLAIDETEEKQIPYAKPIPVKQEQAAVAPKAESESLNKNFKSFTGFLSVNERDQQIHKGKSRFEEKKTASKKALDKVMINDPLSNQQQGSLRSQLKNNFNLKQAVIYSEILNRKYT